MECYHVSKSARISHLTEKCAPIAIKLSKSQNKYNTVLP